MAHGWRGGRLIPKTFQQWLMHIMGSQRIVARSSSLFVCHPNLRTCTHYSTASPIHHFVCTVVRKNPNCSWKKAFTLIPGCRFMSSGSKQINNNISLEDGMLQRYVESLVTQYTEAEQALLNSTDSISRSENTQRVYRLGSIVREYRMYITKRTEMEELDAIITANEDEEMVKMAKQDLEDVQSVMQELQERVVGQLVLEERTDNNDILLEVTAGVGGQEAMLFTDQMLKMYTNFALTKRWTFDTIEYDPSEQGGLRHASAIVKGTNVYRYLKFEAGVHRVQRVPKTEKSGRMHTSTMTVSVLPQPTEIDVQINKKDLKVDLFRASGSGGQHVNTTESAVRLTHLPTGMVAECQVSRSQIKNRELALEVLRSRLYRQELEQQQQVFKSQKKIQIGTAARSEKIRTYNFHQDRITDHRLSGNQFNIDKFLEGGEVLEDLMEALQEDLQSGKLTDLLEQFENQEKLTARTTDKR